VGAHIKRKNQYALILIANFNFKCFLCERELNLIDMHLKKKKINLKNF
jgi:hypothetical protein